MTRRYKNLIYCCILLSALFVGLVALPQHWYLKLEMDQREYETAKVEASEEMLNAKGKAERQLAVRRVQRLHRMEIWVHSLSAQDLPCLPTSRLVPR